MNTEKTIKVKILKSVGNYTIGQEVDVPSSQAEYMCTVRKKHDGTKLVDHRTAITMEEFNKLKDLPINKGGLTLDELKDLGLRNVVETPKSELEKPFHPGFSESKDPAEGHSAKAAQEINANNNHQKRKAS